MGKSSELTLERLQAVVSKLALPNVDYWKQHYDTALTTPLTKGYTTTEDAAVCITDSKQPYQAEKLKEQLEAVVELVSKWKGDSKQTRDWTKANQLIKELEGLFTKQKAIYLYK